MYLLITVPSAVGKILFLIRRTNKSTWLTEYEYEAISIEY